MTAVRQASHRRWSLHSLRVRILLAMLLWVELGIGGIWYSATRLFAKHVEASYHEELEVHVKELAGLVRVRADGTLTMDRPLSDPRYQVPLSGFYWQVSRHGQAAMRSTSMTRGSLDESVAHESTVHHHIEGGPTGPTITYGFVRSLPGAGEVHFLIATDERLLNETIASFDRELILWLALLASALAVSGLMVVHFGLRPLDRLAHATARLRSGMAGTLEGQYPVEIEPLVGDLNAFIEHNRKAVERARVEAGNLAHALRTPLAVITDEAERLAQIEATSASGQTVLEQGQIMVQQIEYQLARARSAGRVQGPGTISQLDQVLPPILSAMRRLHPDKIFTVAAPLGLDRAIPVDPVDLSELLAIILDNAGKWARGEIRVEVQQEGDDLAIHVMDDGPGLTPAQAEQAYRIGSRFDPAMPGSGLGLAIARDIADAYGLRLDLVGRPDGLAGLDAVIALPLSACSR